MPTRRYGRAEPSPTTSVVPSTTASALSSTLASIASSTPPVTQPTTYAALTTTFTPPPSCYENRLTMLPPPGYFIWVNEPVPFANQTSSACYPSEFISSYSSVPSSTVGSSVVPAMSPFACPANYCTMFTAVGDYVACCPFGFKFHEPDTTVDTKRPGYGGTCYSDFSVSSTYTVTAYDTVGSTKLAEWVASTSGAQAYAHPIDGFAAVYPYPVLGCPTSLSNSTGPGPNASITEQNKMLSQATIAGVTIGAISALSLVLALIWIILRSVRKNRINSRSDARARPVIHHIDHERSKFGLSRSTTETKNVQRTSVVEKDTSQTCEIECPLAKILLYRNQMNDGAGPAELSGDPIPELEASEQKRDYKFAIEPREEANRDEAELDDAAIMSSTDDELPGSTRSSTRDATWEEVTIEDLLSMDEQRNHDASTGVSQNAG